MPLDLKVRFAPVWRKSEFAPGKILHTRFKSSVCTEGDLKVRFAPYGNSESLLFYQIGNVYFLFFYTHGTNVYTFFLFDNYRDKQRIKNAIEKANEDAITKVEIDLAIAENRRKAEENDKIKSIKKNIEILKTGKICNGSVKPKSHQWVFNNITKEALLILNENEYSSLGIFYNPEGVCTIEAVNQNLGEIYTRYAKQSEVDRTISSVETMLK